MDKSWILCKRTTPEFRQGVETFIQFALAHKEEGKKISCPCKNCGNMGEVSTSNELREHIFFNGFTKSYTQWIWHGERVESVVNDNNDDHHEEMYDDHENETNGFVEEILVQEDLEAEREQIFDSLLSANKEALYPGSTCTRLSGVLTLFKLKATFGWSDKSFTELLKELKTILPKENELPSSTYHAKKLLCPMGLNAEKIHACRNDCVLFKKDYKDLRECPKCGASRYKESNKSKGDKEGPPAKVLWYLPIIPRFKRLFANVNDAKQLTWHEERDKDEMIRNVADSPQWQKIDKDFPEFGSEARNLRLGLCTDGINPFGNMSSQHSTWPILLTIYNLPPWLCMKRKYIMLSLLISGPKQPGNDICVYLAPLLEDMLKLWHEGVFVYDAYQQETFTLRAMIYCTINDFPAYGNLSGHATKGYKACPICDDDTKAILCSSDASIQ